MLDFLEKKEKILIRILWIGTVLAGIKSIFTDTGFDNSYAVAMSYRHLNGDSMLKYMWEPHQTSIFVTDILMWIYHLVVPDYTGVMLYLQVCGTIILAIVGYALYVNLAEYAGKKMAALAGIFFFIFRAKQTPFPDFSNLQICFSALAFIFAIRFLKNEQKWWLPVLSAVCLCLEVLAYPSSIITFVPILIFFIVTSEKKVKNALLFSGTCVVIGIAYVGYFVARLGLSQLLSNIENIFYSDSHSGEWASSTGYFSGVEAAVIWILAVSILSFIIAGLTKVIKKEQIEYLPVFGILMFLSEAIMLVSQKKTGIDWTCTFYIIPLLMVIFSTVMGYKKMSVEEKRVWAIGLAVSLSSFIATSALSDLGIIAIVSYMVLGGVISVIPLKYCGKQATLFLISICALVTLHRGLVVWGYANKGNVWMVNDIEAVITEGPSAGIASDYMRYYQTKCDIEDHPKFVNKEDRIFFVEGYVFDSVDYLMTEASISNSSTIDTPVYNERILTYFELYPEKEPTVIAVSCWYGNLRIGNDELIMQWINENYEPVGDGRYWRYYRKK